MTSRLKGTLRGLKRSEILERGSHLFYQQGFSRTGVSEITDAAGVPKGSFYNYFDSKADFGIECLRRYEEHWTRELEAALRESGESPLKRIRDWYRRSIQEVVSKGYGRGCFAGNLAQELGDSDPRFRVELSRIFKRFEETIAQCLGEAQEAGEVSPDLDPYELAEFMMNAWQGALVRMKTDGTAEPLEVFDRIVFERLLG